MGTGIFPRFLLCTGPVSGQHRCIICASTPLITEQICVFLYAFQTTRETVLLYQQHPGLFAFASCYSVQALGLVLARKVHPVQHTGVRRPEAHYSTELVNGKPGCLVFSSPRFLKKCFPNIVMCHKVFPPLPVASPLLGWESQICWQAVQQNRRSCLLPPRNWPL